MTRLLCSNGESSASAYVLVVVRARAAKPIEPDERVVILPPSCTPTAHALRPGDQRRGSGPRNPEQAVWPLPKPPAVELPDGLSAMQPQRVLIDPEVATQWRVQAAALAAEEAERAAASAAQREERA